MTEAAIRLAARPAHRRSAPDLRGLGGADPAPLSPRGDCSRAWASARSPWRSAFLASSCSRSSPRAGRPSGEAYVKLDITFDPAVIDPQGTRDPATYRPGQLRGADQRQPASAFPGRHQPRRTGASLRGLVSSGAAAQLRDMVLADPALIGQTGRSGWSPTTRSTSSSRARVDRDAAPRPTAGINDRGARLARQAGGARAGWRRGSTGSSSPPAIRASPSSPASTAPCGARPT